MAFTQTTFFGLSIANFNSSMGWGDSPSTLNVTLVQDASNGDALITPVLGQPATFAYSAFSFGGIVKSFNRADDFGGSPIYNITLEDPREILSGVTIILSNYNGTISVPNILNVYGYLESIGGFGSSRASTSGIPSYLVKDAIVALTSGSNPDYGGHIVLGSYEFRLNLSELPTLEDYYRITSPNMSVLDFVREICDATNHEYHFRLITIAGINYIYLKTINRNAEPNLSSISSFIINTPGAVSKSTGYEFRNEITSKFLIGGSVSRMYGIDDVDLDLDGRDSTTPEEDMSIWPFWGIENETDSVDNISIGSDLIFGRGDLFDGHTFTVDCRTLKSELLRNDYFKDHTGIFDTYTMDIGELRAAKYSQESWESYLWFHNYNRFRLYHKDYSERNDIGVGNIDDDSIEIAYEETTFNFNADNGNYISYDSDVARWFNRQRNSKDIVRYKANYRNARNQTFSEQFPFRSRWGVPNPHFGKAKRMGLVGGILTQDLQLFLGDADDAELEKLRADSMSSMRLYDHKAGYESNIHEENIARIYNFVKKYSDEYYGKKWMVKVPSISAYRDTETNQIIFSHEPEGTGFIDESEWEDAITNNLLPFDVNRISDTDGKIFAYVKFPKYLLLDVTDKILRKIQNFGQSSLTSDDYDSSTRGRYYKNIYYLFNDIPEEDKIDSEVYDTMFIKCEIDPKIYFEDAATQYGPRVVITMPGIVKLKTRDQNDVGVLAEILDYEYEKRSKDGNTILTSDDTNKELLISNIVSSFGSDMFRFGNEGLAHKPEFAAIPLKSNVNTYGPWYATGSNGKTEFEQDDTLVPWNYGGFEQMNNAANAKVSSAISLYNISEAGQIQVPDTPTMSLGDPLATSGPYVTEISTDISFDGGAKTTYNLSTWTPHPYKISKFQTDYISRLSKTQQQLKRNFRELLRAPKQGSKAATLRKETIDGLRRKPRSTHMVIGGEVVVDSSGFSRSIVGLQPIYNSVTQFYGDQYPNKALSSLDALFVPFSTKIDNTIMAHFEAPTDSGTLNINNYNPFRSGITNTILTHGDEFPDSLLVNQSEDLDYTNVRSIALKTPLILGGWGYDTSGKPVPNSGVIATSGSATDDFHQDYLRRQDLWKVGPLDTRWNDERKVWQAGSASFKFVQILDKIPSSGVDINDVVRESGFAVTYFNNEALYPIAHGLLTGRYGSATINGNRAMLGGMVYYVREYSVSFSGSVGSRCYLTPTETYHYAGNFRPNVVEPSGIWLASDVNGKLLLDSQMQFWDFNINE